MMVDHNCCGRCGLPFEHRDEVAFFRLGDGPFVNGFAHMRDSTCIARLKARVAELEDHLFEVQAVDHGG